MEKYEPILCRCTQSSMIDKGNLQYYQYQARLEYLREQRAIQSELEQERIFD